MLGRNIAADGNATERTEEGRKEGKKERLTREGGDSAVAVASARSSGTPQ